MASTTTLVIGAIIDIIPVMGGAAIGILGGLAGTNYGHSLSVRDAERLERKSKLEVMVIQSFEIDVWLKKVDNYHLYGGYEVLAQPPIAKIEAFGALYFPELTEEIRALSYSYNNYFRWLLQGSELRRAARTAVPPDEHMDKFIEVYTPLLVGRQNFVKKAKELGASLQTT